MLRNGDIVEVVTSKAPKGPSRDWLNPNLGYIKTAHARDKIRQWFKRQQRDDNIIRGREMLEKELKRLGLDQAKLDDIASAFKYDKLDDFLAAVGYGDISPQHIAMKLLAEEEEKVAIPEATPSKATEGAAGIKVMGVGDLLTNLARCCNPVPGDPIVGYITRGKGVTIHRQSCANVRGRKEQERLVKVEWGPSKRLYPVAVRIEAWDRDGLLRDIATVVAEDKVNMAFSYRNVACRSHRHRQSDFGHR